MRDMSFDAKTEANLMYADIISVLMENEPGGFVARLFGLSQR